MGSGPVGSFVHSLKYIFFLICTKVKRAISKKGSKAQ